MNTRTVLLAAVTAIALLVIVGIELPKTSKAGPEKPEHVPEVKPVGFDETNKSAIESGNMNVAISKTLRFGGNMLYHAESTTVSMVSKMPYSYLGKLVRLRGQIYRMEQQAPVNDVVWTEVLLLAGNKNSAAGVTTVSFTCKKALPDVDAGDRIEIAGYFAGTYESTNSMGGAVDAIVVVGDDYRMIRKKRR